MVTETIAQVEAQKPRSSELSFLEPPTPAEVANLAAMYFDYGGHRPLWAALGKESGSMLAWSVSRRNLTKMVAKHHERYWIVRIDKTTAKAAKT